MARARDASFGASTGMRTGDLASQQAAAQQMQYQAMINARQQAAQLYAHGWRVTEPE